MKTHLAAAALLLTAASPGFAQQGSLQCVGTEPFWSVTFTGRAMWFSDPESRRIELVPVRPIHAIARQQDHVRVYQTRRVDRRGRGVTLVVTRHEQTCTDGMSETRYPYSAVYINEENGVYEGCCRWIQ